MSLTHLFLAFSVAVGVAVGTAVAEFPALRALNLPPYILILIALAVFDVATFLRGGGAPGTMITMGVRFVGFALALGAMVLIVTATGVEVTYF